MLNYPLRGHRFLLAVLLVSLLGLAWMRGWFSTTVAFRSISRDFQVGRPLNQYTPPGPAVFLVTNQSDVNALSQYLQLQAGWLTDLQGINYDQEFLILVLQGIGGSRVQVERVHYQWRRLLIEARFLTPGWGAGQPAVVTDAYDLIAIPRAPFEDTYLTIEVWDWWHRVATASGQIGEPARLPSTPTMPPPATTELVPVVSDTQGILIHRSKATPIAG